MISAISSQIRFDPTKWGFLLGNHNNNKNSYHLLNPCLQPGSVVSTLYTLAH